MDKQNLIDNLVYTAAILLMIDWFGYERAERRELDVYNALPVWLRRTLSITQMLILIAVVSIAIFM